jgi:hypothetical protein
VLVGGFTDLNMSTPLKPDSFARLSAGLRDGDVLTLWEESEDAADLLRELDELMHARNAVAHADEVSPTARRGTAALQVCAGRDHLLRGPEEPWTISYPIERVRLRKAA